MSVFILPVAILLVLTYAVIKRVNLYECFLDGGRESLALIKTIFPYVAAIFACITLFKASGLSDVLSRILATPLGALGIPSEVAELLFISPLSGHGALVSFQSIAEEYGVDSYVARCAAVISGATETIFYIAAVYFSKVKVRSLRYAIPVSLFATLCGAVAACAICKVL